MLPVALTVAVALAICGWWRGLAAWLFAVIGVLGAMALLKYICFACAVPLEGTGIRSPSGHAAASSVIYGGVLLLLLRDRLPGWASIVIPAGVAVLISVTRLAVHAHDLIEVCMGSAVGLAGAAALVWLAGRRPNFRAWPVGAAVIVAMTLFHGDHLVAEQPIHHFPLFTWMPLPSLCRI